MSDTILLIEDDAAFQRMLVEALEGRGWGVTAVGSAEEGVEALVSGSYSLVLTDVMLPGMTGIESLPKLKEAAPDTDIIVMTAFSTREKAVEALKFGAYDYFTKPFSLSEMEIVIRRALERRSLRREVAVLRRELRREDPAGRIIGHSQPIMLMKALLGKIAPLDTTVLITGESGTGKELAADTIHALSGRSDGPFVKINCAAIPENLLESELFGFEKGAFTGANATRPGKFEQAAGGTIMLDEIGEMPLSLQAKILRAVEYKQIERLGGKESIHIDTRIVAATNQDLQALSDRKEFRADLFYRLNVATIHLPPLRDRREDIPALAEFFIDRVNARIGRDFSAIAPDAVQELMGHDWPGNVRQLANIIERAAIVCDCSVLSRTSVLQAFQKDLHVLPLQVGGKPKSLKETLQSVERTLILNALKRAGGKQSEAAKMLGITPKNLWNKLQKHELLPEEYALEG